MDHTTRQLALALRPPPRWGGRREGAGRKPGARPRDPHRRRPALATRFPCHVTLRVRRNLPSLRTRRFVKELRRRLRPAREHRRFRLVHYSIQADHLHLIVEASGSRDLARGMKSIGARVARAVNRVLARRGPVLADRYHRRVPTHAARGAERAGVRAAERAQALAAALWGDTTGAARRSVVGAVDRRVAAGAERRSRARSGPREVARTWLLAAGWRRHGLIDPAEVPGS